MTKENSKPQDGAIREVKITVHDDNPAHDAIFPSTTHFPASLLTIRQQAADRENADSSLPWNVGIEQYDAAKAEWKMIYQNYERKQIKRGP